MLLMAYGAATVIGASSSSMPSKFATVSNVPARANTQIFSVSCSHMGINLINMQVFCHCALALVLWVRAQSVDLSSKEAVTSFYMFIWKASESISPGIIALACKFSCN